MLNDQENSVFALLPALLFVILIAYLMMSDPFVSGPF